MNIGGHSEDNGEGELSPGYIIFVKPSDIPKHQVSLGGLSPEGDAEFRRILGDNFGKPLSAEERETALDEFRTWVMKDFGPARMRDLNAVQTLLIIDLTPETRRTQP